MNAGALIFYFLVVFVIGMVAEGIRYRANENDENPEVQNAQAEIERRWSTQCEPYENLRVVCFNRTRSGDEWYILTSKRLVIEGGEHLREIPLDTIMKIKMTKMKSADLIIPSNIKRITLRTSIGKVKLVRSSNKFDDLAECFFEMHDKLNLLARIVTKHKVS